VGSEQIRQVDLVGTAQDRIAVVDDYQVFFFSLFCEAVGVVINIGRGPDEQAIEQARKEYIDEYRKNYLKVTLSEPVVITDGAAEDMAKRYFGENLELAPDLSD